MQRIRAVLAMILIMSIGIVGISIAENIADPTWYKPICLSCGNPVVSPTPTPIPSTHIDVGFTMPAKVRSGSPFTVSGYQNSGSPVSALATWRYDYKQGSITRSVTGQTSTITLTNSGTNTIRLYVTDLVTNSYGSTSGSIVVK